MQEICELTMLICFGISWPISVYKSYRSRSTKGKSPIFILAIIVGYIAGIVGKLIGGQITYVLAFYCLNLSVVISDLALYARNRHIEEKRKEFCGTKEGNGYERSGFEKSECRKGA